MPAITSLAYPSAVLTMIALLEPLSTVNKPIDVRVAPPPDYDGGRLIIVKRIGGGPDSDDTTDYPIMLISSFGEDYYVADEVDKAAQVAILSSVLTEVNGVLIDHAEIYVGEQEIPDVYPDERRINSTYRMGWRRQFRP